MSISDKLLTIAENEQKIYDKGFEEGKKKAGDNELLNSLIDRSITEIYNDQITEVGDSAFQECINLTKVELPNITKIGSYAFCRCNSLEHMDLSKIVEIDNYAFQNCDKLKSIDISKISYLGYDTFYHCNSLESVKFSEHNDITCYQFVFGKCISLKEVNIKKGATIGDDTFCYCSNLQSVKIGGDAKIGFNCFAYCTNLQKVDIGGFLRTTYIRYNKGLQFSNCTKLDTVIIRGYNIGVMDTTTAFNDTPIEAGTGYIYVPKALIEDYKVATNWCVYANQFRAIEDYPEICGEV